jgi:hypothetical protein
MSNEIEEIDEMFEFFDKNENEPYPWKGALISTGILFVILMFILPWFVGLFVIIKYLFV